MQTHADSLSSEEILARRLMRLADSYGVPRQQFIDEYYGNELDHGWLDRMANATGRNRWAPFIRTERKTARVKGAEFSRHAVDEVVQGEPGSRVLTRQQVAHVVTDAREPAQPGLVVEKVLQLVLSTLRPFLMAHMLAPLPRWATTTDPWAISGATLGRARAMYS